MSERLFTESFFKKNDYFRKESNLTNDKLREIKEIVINWQKRCENFNSKTDHETADEDQFMNAVFEKILGYNGKALIYNNYNYTSNFTIEGSGSSGKSGFADRALGYFGQDNLVAQVLIEFKDQKSNDLDKPSSRKDKLSPVNQCWNYLNYYPEAKWGIVSNFNEIRLYNKASGKNKCEIFYFIPPDLFHNPLSVDTELMKFITLLSKDHILTNFGKSFTEDLLLKQGSAEEMVRKEFYIKYKYLRKEVFQEILYINKQYESEKNRLLLLVQKFLDRIIFCWFCEDSRENLLPTNILSEVISEESKGKFYKRTEFTTWEKVKALFRAIDKGEGFNIKVGYNGGLFKEDKELDNLKIRNHIFDDISAIGKQYDFGNENELNVNILGHIFEQSITDLEDMRSTFMVMEEGLKEKEVSKRKKEGVYYTPEYITHYIVENTVGAWLKEKYQGCEKKYSNKFKNREELVRINYRDNYLKKIKILDPACGSGAFLIASFNYLWNEHLRIYNELKSLKEDKKLLLLDLDEVDRSILENNLYGVDLNSESVEITKLSLWLKTAHRGKKLNNLDNTIKCGNSLIDDPTIAGEKAFNWEEHFSEIFSNGGFDVIIGNPPYVVLSSFKNKEFSYLQNKYSTSYGRLNTFALFLERISKNLINKNNYKIGLIIPDSLCLIDYYTDLRKFLLDSHSLKTIIELGDGIFDDAVVPSIIIIMNNKTKNNVMKIGFGKRVFEKNIYSEINQDYYYHTPKYSYNLHVDKISIKLNNLIDNKTFFKLKDVIQIKIGICTGANDKHISDNSIFPNSKKLIQGKDINRYSLIYDGKYVNYDRKALLRARDESIFILKEKLFMRQTSDELILSFDDEQYYAIDSLFILYPISQILNLKYCLCLLNSKLLNRQYQKLNPEAGRVFAQVKIDYVNELTIAVLLPEEQKPFIEKADCMLYFNRTHHDKQSKFLNRLKDNFHSIKITEKLEDFYDSDFSAFLDELKKQKIYLGLKDQDEWGDYFKGYQKELLKLKAEIEKTDYDIDRMVYELYGLTDEEIKVVEGE